MSNRVLSLGQSIIEGVMSAQVIPDGPDGSGAYSAQVTVETARLAAADADYISEAKILDRSGSVAVVEFTGIVDSVIPEGEVTHINLVTMLHLLNEQTTGGVAIQAVDTMEVLRSLMRNWGIEDEKIDFEGLERLGSEMFEVSVPIRGAKLHENLDLGIVQLVSGGPASLMADGLAQAELSQKYKDADCWAITFLAADSFFDAEIRGLRAIDVALAWFSAAVAYSGAHMPNGLANAFRRTRLMSSITRGEVVSVRRSQNGDRSLHAITDPPVQHTLDATETKSLLRASPSLHSMPVTIGGALLSWWRAREHTDKRQAIVAMWESLEFYASGARAPKMFEDAEIRLIKAAVPKGLEVQKEKRVLEAIDKLNDAPLMVRLKVATDEDKVPISDDEMKLLQILRKARNDIMHGDDTELPTDAVLRYGISIVNRILLYRVYRLNLKAVTSSLLVLP